MKKLILPILVFLYSHSSNAQWIQHDVTFDNTQRLYDIYLPNKLNEHPNLIVVLSSLDQSEAFNNHLQLNILADTTNSILLFPKATSFENGFLGFLNNMWNTGATINNLQLGVMPINEDVRDVEFIEFTTKRIIDIYGVDTQKVYLLGYGMGAYMAQRIAYKIPTVYKSIFCIGGSKPLAIDTPQFNLPIPMGILYGTNDDVARSDGAFVINSLDLYLGIPRDSLIQSWKQVNRSSRTLAPEIIGSANSNLFINRTVHLDDQYEYPVAIYEVVNGAHDWYQYAHTNNEFDYGVLAWRFFNKKFNKSTTGIKSTTTEIMDIYPNPVENIINFSLTKGQILVAYTIYNLAGQNIRSEKSNFQSLDVSNLFTGSYYIEMLDNKGNLFTSKFMKL